MTFQEYLDAHEPEAWRSIRRTDLSSDAYVSTVFLGFDHRFDDGPPLLFETMVFGGPLAEQQWRYSTIEEAERGHDAAVTMARRADGISWKLSRFLARLSEWIWNRLRDRG